MYTTIYSEPANNCVGEVFNSLAERPTHFRTRAEWKRKGRKVIDKITPAAKVMLPHRFEPVGLFIIDQTRPYNPTPRTRAFDDYWNTFIKDHNNGVYIYRSDEDDCWFTDGDEEMPTFLIRRDVRNHVRGARV